MDSVWSETRKLNSTSSDKNNNNRRKSKVRVCELLTSVLQEHAHTSLLPFSSGEVQQSPAVGVSYLRGVASLQHPPDGADVTRRHGSLDLQLLMEIRVSSAVMVQHPVTGGKREPRVTWTGPLTARSETFTDLTRKVFFCFERVNVQEK